MPFTLENPEAAGSQVLLMETALHATLCHSECSSICTSNQRWPQYWECPLCQMLSFPGFGGAAEVSLGTGPFPAWNGSSHFNSVIEMSFPGHPSEMEIGFWQQSAALGPSHLYVGDLSASKGPSTPLHFQPFVGTLPFVPLVSCAHSVFFPFLES